MSDPVVRLAARGDGVTAAGVFLARTAPGDMLEPDGTITAGPHRQTPPCRHFGKCGGCQLQHVDDAAYAGFVTERIASIFASQGMALPELRPPHLSPASTRRRVALKAVKQGKRVMLGFNEGASHTLLDLAECPVMHPKLCALIAPLRGLLGLLMRDRRPAEVRMTLADQGVDLLISGVEVEGLAATEALTDFGAKYGLARLSIDEGYGPSPRYEPEKVTVSFGGIFVELPDGAFLQATMDAEAVLVSAVRECVGASRETLDLFAGLGTFALSLPGKIHAVEGARGAIVALQSAANRAQRAVTSEHRDLFRRPLMTAELARFDAVVLDPPRAGAKEQVAELAASTVPRIAYVSCNPATFSRDAKMLTDGGYTLNWVQPVGQFRWSTHVELAGCFTR